MFILYLYERHDILPFFKKKILPKSHFLSFSQLSFLDAVLCSRYFKNHLPQTSCLTVSPSGSSRYCRLVTYAGRTPAKYGHFFVLKLNSSQGLKKELLANSSPQRGGMGPECHLDGTSWVHLWILPFCLCLNRLSYSIGWSCTQISSKDELFVTHSSH